MDNGYTKEEMKLAREPQKILDDSTFSITATAVRIPTSGGHSEAVNVEFELDFDTADYLPEGFDPYDRDVETNFVSI